MTKTITKYVIPYLEKHSNFFDNIDKSKLETVNDSRSEISFLISVNEFFLPHGLSVSWLPSREIWAEPDLILTTLDGLETQFCQLKYSSDFSGLKYEMNQSITKYKKVYLYTR